MGKSIGLIHDETQRHWIIDRLIPGLKAGGADVRRLDETKGSKEIVLAVLTPSFLANQNLLRQIKKILKLGKRTTFIPILRVGDNLRELIKSPDWVDLRDDNNIMQWDKLFLKCEANLGTTVPDWLNARDSIRRFLQRNVSVNLVISGRPQWMPLFEHLCNDHQNELRILDLERGATVVRPGLVTAILETFDVPTDTLAEPNDLVMLDQGLCMRSTVSKLALAHFDLVQHRPSYDVNLFAALRNLIMEVRKLVLIAQSRKPFLTLLPKNHPLSYIDVRTVELKGR